MEILPLKRLKSQRWWCGEWRACGVSRVQQTSNDRLVQRSFDVSLIIWWTHDDDYCEIKRRMRRPSDRRKIIILTRPDGILEISGHQMLKISSEEGIQSSEFRIKAQSIFLLHLYNFIHAISIFRPEIVQVESASEWATKNNRIITCDVFNLISLER